MKLGMIATIFALGAACLTGCVAQVGQPEERTGVSRAQLGNGQEEENGGDPQQQEEQTTNNHASDPGNNPTSDDNQGPQPLPWTASNTSGPSSSKK